MNEIVAPRASFSIEDCAAPIRLLLEAAVWAPSGDNTQPWQFRIDRKLDQLEIFVDPSRDPSPMNAGQHMARLAVGAAVENMSVVLRRQCGEAEDRLRIEPDRVIVNCRGVPNSAMTLPPEIKDRVSNRKPFDARPLPEHLLSRLQEEVLCQSPLRLHWISNRGAIESLAATVSAADELMFGSPSMRKAFLKNVRFDRSPTDEVEEGLSLASLEIARNDLPAFRMLPKLPHWACKLGRVSRKFAANGKRLVESASGIAICMAADWDWNHDFAIGRLMQRTWLALTKEGLSVQPLMSIPVLANTSAEGGQDQARIPGARIAALSQELAQALGEPLGCRPAFLLRFGWGASPTGRVARRTPKISTS